jgi:hypothetical protein
MQEAMRLRKLGDEMSRHTPYIYMASVFVAFLIVWFVFPEQRLVNLFVALPGLLLSTFATLWRELTRLRNNLTRLERRIAALEK